LEALFFLLLELFFEALLGEGDAVAGEDISSEKEGEVDL